MFFYCELSITTPTHDTPSYTLIIYFTVNSALNKGLQNGILAALLWGKHHHCKISGNLNVSYCYIPFSVYLVIIY